MWLFSKLFMEGTYNFIVEEFPKYGIEYDFTDGFTEEDFKSKIKKIPRVIYVETPSNPLMKITDLTMISKLAKRKG